MEGVKIYPTIGMRVLENILYIKCMGEGLK